MYWDDRYNTETVSADVLSRMKQQMASVNNMSSHSFLLDDDATLPFLAGEVLGGALADDRELHAALPSIEVLGGDFAFLEKPLSLV